MKSHLGRVDLIKTNKMNIREILALASSNYYDYEWNIPMEILSKGKPLLKYNLAIYNDLYIKRVIRIEDGAISRDYHEIIIVGKDSFFVSYTPKNGKCIFGLSIFQFDKTRGCYVERRILNKENDKIYLMTIPNNNYFFCCKSIDDKHSSVLLYNIDCIESSPIIAIESIETKFLLENIAVGNLRFEVFGGITQYKPSIQMSSDSNGKRLIRNTPKYLSSIHNIGLYDTQIFDESFVKQTSGKIGNQRSKYNMDNDEVYWFSDKSVAIENPNKVPQIISKYDYDDSYRTPFDNPHYNDALDMDQQSPDFWENL